jgi:hypothetical protein
MNYDLNRQEFGNPFEWEVAVGGSAPFLHHRDTTFDSRDILVTACQDKHGTTGQGLDQSFEGKNSPSAWTLVMRKPR